jgi:hypothetical protein
MTRSDAYFLAVLEEMELDGRAWIETPEVKP